MMKSKKSINELKQESEKGDLSASISLALISEMGFYKDADQQEAMKFWERAAQQDDPMAVKCYIHCLENLPEDQQDPKKIDALKDQLKKLGFRSNESLVTRFNEAGALRRVLVVDDDSDFCQLICDSLETLPNIKVAWANRGSLGLRKIVEMKGIELLMVDVNMPEMSGPQLVKILKTQSSLAHVPVIVMTGLSPHDKIPGMQGMEVKKILHKPIKIAELRKVVMAVLEQSESQRAV